MDTRPVKNSDAARELSIAIAHLSLAATHFGMKDHAEQEKAAEILLDSACTLYKQVTK